MTWSVRGVAIALLAVGWLSPGGLQAQDGSDEWQWRASVYGWLPDLEAKTEFPTGQGGPTINVDASTLLDNLDFTAMAALQARKGAWGMFTDALFMDLGASESGVRDVTLSQAQLPAEVSFDLVYDMKSWVWTLAGTYNLASSEANTTDFLFGARMVDIEQSLKWTAQGEIESIEPPARAGSGEVSFTNWDAIIGVKGFAFLGEGKRWLIPYHFDIGTGDSDFTVQAMTGLGYSFSWGEVVATWRYLDYDLPSDGLVRDLNFSGPMVGASFSW